MLHPFTKQLNKFEYASYFFNRNFLIKKDTVLKTMPFSIAYINFLQHAIAREPGPIWQDTLKDK